MKILFTSRGDSWDSEIDPRFGRTEFFFIYDDDSEEVQTYDNRDIANQAHGAGPRTAQKMADYKVDVMVTGNGPGGNAAAVVEKMGVKVYAGAGGMTVKEAYQSFRDGKLSEF